MGHLVIDKGGELLKGFVEKLAAEKGKEDELALYEMVERLAPEIISGERTMYKGVSANVDFYSGFVYRMLDLPEELYPTIFAIARIVGWSAHRMEELANNGKIIRPAYMAIEPRKDYVPMNER
jgi:citrate synthase